MKNTRELTITLEVYRKLEELADMDGKTVSEIAEELIMKGA